MEFEFDEAKSAVNLAKHGIDFMTAQELWRDNHRIRLMSVRRARAEEVALYEGEGL